MSESRDSHQPEGHASAFQEEMKAAAQYIHHRVRYRLATRPIKSTKAQDLGRAKPEARQA